MTGYCILSGNMCPIDSAAFPESVYLEAVPQ